MNKIVEWIKLEYYFAFCLILQHRYNVKSIMEFIFNLFSQVARAMALEFLTVSSSPEKLKMDKFYLLSNSLYNNNESFLYAVYLNQR